MRLGARSIAAGCSGFFVGTGRLAGLPPNRGAADCPSRFRTFLNARSFVFNNLTASFGNFVPTKCYFYSNFVMRIVRQSGRWGHGGIGRPSASTPLPQTGRITQIARE
jgi:hypothetical protein